MNDLGFYLKLLARRLPIMAALLLLASCIGIVIALRLPTTYSTQATLLVEAAQIDDVNTVRVDADEQLDVIQQRLLTRANLITVARANNLFPDQNRLDPDVIVRQMLQNTKVRRSGGRDRATVMTISFEGSNPQQVAGVVNQYVNVVLEINSEFRVGQAEGALEFFEQEVDRLSQDLDLQSAKIVAFKSQNADALPENLDYRLNRQSLLQERLSRSERDLEAANIQRANMTRLSEVASGSVALVKAPRTPEQERLEDLNSQLSAALGVYSETNPRIKLLRSQINVLEGQVAAQLADQETSGANGTVTQASALDITIAELDTRIQNLTLEVSDITEELASLGSSIDRTPANRISLEAMERDLANIQALYSEAVVRLSQARMGERIELSAKGERITVLEPASVPSEPSGPNRLGIAGVGFMVGLALAAGWFMLLELLNQSIRRPTDIVKALDITPLATIPRFEVAADRRWRRTVQLLVLALVIVAVPGLLWAIDTYYMPLDQLFQKVRDRF